MFENDKNFQKIKKNPARLLIPLAIILIGVYAIHITNESKPDWEKGPSPKAQTFTTGSADFQKAARARLDEVAKAIPELENYTCEGDDCSSVIYFNFKTRPADLDTIIRGNTVTFSNFKKVLTGTSHVTFTAKLNGRTILSCNGSNGVTKECK